MLEVFDMYIEEVTCLLDQQLKLVRGLEGASEIIVSVLRPT